MYDLISETGRNTNLQPFFFITLEVGRLIKGNPSHNLISEIGPKLTSEIGQTLTSKIGWTLISEISHDLGLKDGHSFIPEFRNPVNINLYSYDPISRWSNKHKTLIHITLEVGRSNIMKLKAYKIN